jgi:hypothetical protein
VLVGRAKNGRTFVGIKAGQDKVKQVKGKEILIEAVVQAISTYNIRVTQLSKTLCI